MKPSCSGLAVLCAAFIIPVCDAISGLSVESTNELTSMSLEELMHVKVTSVSRKSQNIIETPAAVSVLTSDDISRSGYLHLPDMMRLVPGFEVAKIDGSKWAISSRGFNSYFANKLLVMVDGRSVYSPINAGVFWDDQDVMLEDVERVELVRGPGGSLWGANAVNGVINVITKDSRDTQGTLLTMGGGVYDEAFAAVRHGWKFGDGQYARVYAKGFSVGESRGLAGGSADDSWGGGSAGFRTDSHLSEDTVTVQGDMSRHAGNDIFSTGSKPPVIQMIPEDWSSLTANLLGRWTHNLGADSDTTLQMYYDYASRTGFGSIDHQADTIDIDDQYRFLAGPRNEILVGAGYRFIANTLSGSEFIEFNRNSHDLNLYSMFAQDEITLVEDRVKLTFGSKFEHNDYTGVEVQPGGRLLWTPDRQNSVWMSVARAVRTPSIYYTDLRSLPTSFLPAGAMYRGSPATMMVIEGNPDSSAEEMIAYELGYRTHPVKDITVDVATYYNDYSKLTALRPGPVSMSPGGYAVQPLLLLNELEGHTYGAEATVEWQVVRPWRLVTGYTYFAQDVETREVYGQAYGSAEGRKTPSHQAFVRSLWDVARSVRFDSTVRFVDALNDDAGSVPGYTELDLHLAWEMNKTTEWSLGGQNLVHDSHRELFSQVYMPVEVGRTAYVKLTMRF